MRWLCSAGLFIGRILLSLVFIFAGVGKIVNFNESLQYMHSAGITSFAPLLLACALALELFGGFLLIVGYKTRLIAVLLFLFLIPTTLIFHRFWDASEAEKMIQTVMFFKNVAIMGGLLILASTWPGTLSFDRDRNFVCDEKES